MKLLNNPKVVKDVILNATHSLRRLSVALRKHGSCIDADIIDSTINALSSLLMEE